MNGTFWKTHFENESHPEKLKPQFVDNLPENNPQGWGLGSSAMYRGLYIKRFKAVMNLASS